MPTPTPFARKVATTAEEQHAKFQFITEGDPVLCKQIAKWTKDIGFPFSSCTKVPWSAVFISWCVKQAGATKAEFEFAMAHARFVHTAIQNAAKGTGVFQGFDISVQPPAVGDIIQNNRGGTKHNFAFASKNKGYNSHSVIVIEVGEDTTGRFAFCVGGNESDSVRRTVVRLDSKGFIKQRPDNPFICIVKNLK
ncbi:MAG TPA: DUF2272 domain-containing protein [Pyrinomonadaceae bacterium]|jgi:hypothetical protein|nr:DUF2272 domain-containing protein [Pyrinomonadaceae bacterium]